MQDVSLPALPGCREDVANKAFDRSRGGQRLANGNSIAAASVNAVVMCKEVSDD